MNYSHSSGHWLSFFVGIAACIALWVLSFIPSWTNCGRHDCSIHSYLNDEVAAPEPESQACVPARPDGPRQTWLAPDRDLEPEPYLHSLGDIVEHFEVGMCVVNGRRRYNGKGELHDLPIYKLQWYDDEKTKRDVEVWGTELKPVDLPNYPKREPVNLGRDLQIQLMEDRVADRFKKRIQELEAELAEKGD